MSGFKKNPNENVGVRFYTRTIVSLYVVLVQEGKVLEAGEVIKYPRVFLSRLL